MTRVCGANSPHHQQYVGSFSLVIIFFLLMIFVMVVVAFLTLLERKILGCIHTDKGPNKVAFVDIFLAI